MRMASDLASAGADKHAVSGNITACLTAEQLAQQFADAPMLPAEQVSAKAAIQTMLMTQVHWQLL